MNWFLALPALGALVSSIVSSVANVKATKDTNETNAELTRETNAQNRDLYEQNLAWQEDMWNKQTEYNSPAHQVELLKEANINPAAVFGNNSYTPASLPSAPSTPEMKSPQYIAPDYSGFGDAAFQGLNAFYESRLRESSIGKTDADAQIARVEGAFRASKLQNELINMERQGKLTAEQRESIRMANDVMQKTMTNGVLQSDLNTAILRRTLDSMAVDIQFKQLQNDLASLDLDYRARMNDAQLKSYDANIRAALAAANASNASAVNAYAEAAVAKVREAGIKIDNSTAKRIQNAIVNKAYYESGISANELEVSKWRAIQAKDEHDSSPKRFMNWFSKMLPFSAGVHF